MPRKTGSNNRILQRGMIFVLLVILVVTPIGMTWVEAVSAQEDSGVWLDTPVPTNRRTGAEFGKSNPAGGQQFHNAIDIGANGGDPIRAVADGCLIHATWWPSWSTGSGDTGKGHGITPVIYHPGSGLFTYYAHTQKTAFPTLTEPILVHKGDTIAWVGITGKTTGPHIHFAVRNSGPADEGCWSRSCWLDPDTYLGKQANTPVTDCETAKQFMTSNPAPATVPEGVSLPPVDVPVGFIPDGAGGPMPSFEGAQPPRLVYESGENSGDSVPMIIPNQKTVEIPDYMNWVFIFGILIAIVIIFTNKQYRTGAFAGLGVLVIILVLVVQLPSAGVASEPKMDQTEQPRQVKPMKAKYLLRIRVPTPTPEVPAAADFPQPSVAASSPQPPATVSDQKPSIKGNCPVYVEVAISPPSGGHPAVAKFSANISRWGEWIVAAAEEYGLPPAFVAAVMEKESSGHAGAISCSYAVGLMQIMPRDGRYDEVNADYFQWFRDRPTVAELLNPQFNIVWGAAYLRSLLDDYWNDTSCDLASPPGKCYPPDSAILEALKDYFGRGKSATERYATEIVASYRTKR